MVEGDGDPAGDARELGEKLPGSGRHSIVNTCLLYVTVCYCMTVCYCNCFITSYTPTSSTSFDGRWQTSTQSTRRVETTGLKPLPPSCHDQGNIISFCAAISACEKGSAWPMALNLLELQGWRFPNQAETKDAWVPSKGFWKNVAVRK